MNEVIKFKLVDLAAVELREAVTYAVKQCAKLLLVIRRHQLTRRTSRCLFVRSPLVAAGLGHVLKLQASTRSGGRWGKGRRLSATVACRDESPRRAGESKHRIARPNVGTSINAACTDRHRRVVQAVEVRGRRFRTSPAGVACCVVVGASGHDHREVPDHVHYHYRG
jgi:hypothetical protein